MRKTVIASFALLGLFAARAEAQYMPVGPQQSVALRTILNGGWTQCYSAFMSVPIGSNAENVLNQCTGQNIMMAGRATGTDVFLLLAAGARSDVIINTTGANTHVVNGSQWYFSPNGYGAWGFAPIGASVFFDSCDVNSGVKRMCLYTSSTRGGYRIGSTISNGNNYEKVFFQSDGLLAPVPEPASITLLATGLVGVFGAARRRWKTTTAA